MATKVSKNTKFDGTIHTSTLSGLASSNFAGLDLFSNPNDVYSVTETQKLEWIRSQLKLRKGEYTIERPLYVFCGSWNVNAKKPPPDLAKWLIPPQVSSPLQDSSTTGGRIDTQNATYAFMPDIYALGFQEIVDLKLGTGAAALGNHKQSQLASKMWEVGVMSTLGAENYTLIKAKHLVGLSLHVYVKNDLLPHVQDVHSQRVGVGFMGVGGNKGGVCIRFRVHDSSFVFINSHLAAHANKCDNRNQDFKNILERIRFNTTHTAVSAFPFQIINSASPAHPNPSSSHYNQQQGIQPALTTHGLKYTQHQLLSPTQTNSETLQQNMATPGYATDKSSPPLGSSDLLSSDGDKDGYHHETSPFQTQSSLSPSHTTEPLQIAQHVNYPTPNLQQTTLTGNLFQYSQHSQPYPRPNAFISIKEHDNCFWLGDLNYRLNIPVSEIQSVYDTILQCEQQPPIDLLDYSNYQNQSQAIVKSQQPIRYSKLLALDQLLQAKISGQAFNDWHEGIIDFAPTYKYLPGTTQWDPSHKRVPAWCDRIQWIGQDITQLQYQSTQLTISDHFPVRGTFRVLSRTLHLYKKIIFVQLLLKHYLAMQIMSTPRLMFNQSLYNIGFLYYDTPVLSEMTLYNPSSKKALYWRIISPYDAKHIVDDNDIRKLLSASHLSSTMPSVPSYYSSPNHHHYSPLLNQVPAFGTGGIGTTNTFLTNKRDLEELELLLNNPLDRSNPTHPASILSTSQYASLNKRQQLQVQHLLQHNQQQNTVNSQYKKGLTAGLYSSTQHNALLHKLPHDMQSQSALALQLLSNSSHSNPAIFHQVSQPHLYLQHDPFQYTSANTKISTYSNGGNAQHLQSQPPPQPHLITYLPQRNDPFTHLHPTWIKFPALQGKIDPGMTITLPFLIHVKRNDALKLVATQSQLQTSIFFATSFQPLNINNSIHTNTIPKDAAQNLLSQTQQQQQQQQQQHQPLNALFDSSPSTSTHVQPFSTQQLSPLPQPQPSTGPAAAILQMSENLGGKSPQDPAFALQSSGGTNNLSYTPGIQGAHLAPSHLSFNMHHRSHNVNVSICHVQGSYQYSTYGLSLALLCDVYESVRSLQVKQQLINNTTESDFLLQQHARYLTKIKPKFYTSAAADASQSPPQPIPKEFFQLVNGLVKLGLDNPKNYILSDFTEYVTILLPLSGPNGSNRARNNNNATISTPTAVSGTNQPITSTTSTSSQNSAKSTFMLFSASHPDETKDTKDVTLSNDLAINTHQLLIDAKLNSKRLHLHTISPHVDNILLHGALITCLDEQLPIPLDQYKNTSTLWFTLLDLLFNLPEPLFPLGLMDKMTKFRTPGASHTTSSASSLSSSSLLSSTSAQKSPEGSTMHTKLTSTPTKHHHIIGNAVLTSSTTSAPESNPYIFIKYLPQPMRDYHQILYNQQLMSLMSSFCFYILKWLPVSHYNLFIYLLSLIKKILHLLTTLDTERLTSFGLQKTQSSLSSTSISSPVGSSLPFGSSNSSSSVEIDIEKLKHYIIAKFTQACCQINTLYATHQFYPFPLSIITYFLNSPDFL